MAGVPLVLAAGLATFLITPQYRGAASVEIAPDFALAPVSAGGQQAEVSAQAFMRSQPEVIAGDAVLELAAQRLKLNNPSRTKQLKDSLSSKVIGDTQVVRISVTRPLAAQAATWANGVAEAYVEFRRADALQNTLNASEKLNRAIETLRARVASFDQRLTQSPADITQLQAERGRYAGQISALERQLEALPPAGTSHRSPATIISAATIPENPVQPNGAGILAFAVVAGLAIGVIREVAAQRRGASHEDETVDGIPVGRESEPAEYDRASADRLDARFEEVEVRFAGALGRVVSGLLAEIRESREALTSRLEGIQAGGDAAAAGRLRPAGKDLAEGLTQLSSLQGKVDRIGSQLEKVTAGFTLTAQETAIDLANRVRNGDQELQGRLDFLHTEMSQRFADMSSALGGALQDIRSDLSGRISEHNHSTRAVLASLESRFDQRAADLGSGLEQGLHEFKGELEQTRTRFSEILSQVGLDRSELTEKLHRMDVDVSDRLGRVAAKLNGLLDGLRSELSEQLTSNQEQVSSMVGSLHGRIDAATGLAAGLDGRLELVKDQLEGIDAEMSQRIGKAAEELNSEVQTLRDRLSRAVAANSEKVQALLHQAEATGDARSGALADMVDSASKHADDRTAKLASRMNARLRSLEQALAGLEGKLWTAVAERAQPAKRQRKESPTPPKGEKDKAIKSAAKAEKRPARAKPRAGAAARPAVTAVPAATRVASAGGASKKPKGTLSAQKATRKTPGASKGAAGLSRAARR